MDFLPILLLHLGDVALLTEIKDYLSTGRCGIYACNAAWHKGVPQNVPEELTGEVYVGEHKRRLGTTVKSSPDVYPTTMGLDPISLALCPPDKHWTISLPSTA